MSSNLACDESEEFNRMNLVRAVEPNNYVCQVISRHIWLSSCNISSIRGEEEGTNANNNMNLLLLMIITLL